MFEKLSRNHILKSKELKRISEDKRVSSDIIILRSIIKEAFLKRSKILKATLFTYFTYFKSTKWTKFWNHFVLFIPLFFLFISFEKWFIKLFFKGWKIIFEWQGKTKIFPEEWFLYNAFWFSDIKINRKFLFLTPEGVFTVSPFFQFSAYFFVLLLLAVNHSRWYKLQMISSLL